MCVWGGIQSRGCECISVITRVCVYVSAYEQVSVCEILVYGACECKDVSVCFHLALTLGAGGPSQSCGKPIP